MYCKDKQKPKKTHRNLPSFSSTLLDEICRSIDENGECPEKSRARRSSSVRNEETSRTSRACLVEKWMEHKENERIAAKKLENVDNDVLFFSSNSSSSDSSGALSSSESEFFSSSKKSNSVKMPKPIRTNTSPRRRNEELSKSEEGPTKSRSRALKIYANLKKLKQPISPGMKLTNLINSFFANMSRKKSKDASRSKVHQEQSCSSASSSYSRSSIIKNSSKSCENSRNGAQRTVRFDPVGVIVDQDSKPCGKKSIYDDRYGRPPLPPKVEDQRKYDFSVFSKNTNEDEDEDDVFSESSSDLFELDHLSLFGKSDRFCEELPVYKTTYFDKNRGLIR
ncbi:hypothetical protein ACS0TY_022027 [Phlomoides rotata]